MIDYVLLSDSTVDLSTEIIRKIDVSIIPMTFTVCEVDYVDLPDYSGMSKKQYFELLRSGEPITTSQINPGAFIEFFEPFLAEGKDILYLAFSSTISGTYNSACLARNDLLEKYPDRKIVIVDSLSSSLGEGLLLYTAAHKRLNGESICKLEEWLNEAKHNVCHWFTVDDLMFLKRGGRVSATSALIGTALGIKPVLYYNDEGKIIIDKKIRGRRNAINYLVDKFVEDSVLPEDQEIFICHGDSEKDANSLAEAIRQRVNVKNIYVINQGPITVAHTGPGTIGLFYFGKRYKI